MRLWSRHQRRTIRLFLFIVGASVLSGWPTGVEAQRSGADRAVEDIYVARSLRLSRITPTGYCTQEKVGFAGSTAEDQYTFHSIATRRSDGLITNANVATIGRLHACFGPTADPLTINFYAEAVLAGVTFTGRGECRMAKPDYPEPGITVYRCFLELRDLPSDYRGGQLTTNTVASRQNIGESSDPRGYVQPSIATVRLWKKREP
jgi:hypothetical protein